MLGNKRKLLRKILSKWSLQDRGKNDHPILIPRETKSKFFIFPKFSFIFFPYPVLHFEFVQGVTKNHREKEAGTVFINILLRLCSSFKGEIITTNGAREPPRKKWWKLFDWYANEVGSVALWCITQETGAFTPWFFILIR